MIHVEAQPFPVRTVDCRDGIISPGKWWRGSIKPAAEMPILTVLLIRRWLIVRRRKRPIVSRTP